MRFVRLYQLLFTVVDSVCKLNCKLKWLTFYTKSSIKLIPQCVCVKFCVEFVERDSIRSNLVNRHTVSLSFSLKAAAKWNWQMQFSSLVRINSTSTTQLGSELNSQLYVRLGRPRVISQQNFHVSFSVSWFNVFILSKLSYSSNFYNLNQFL